MKAYIIKLADIILLSLVFCASAYAKDFYYLIGGGPYLGNSQSQIEYNVSWVYDILKNNTDNSEIAVYFTDGHSSLKDIYSWEKVDDSKSLIQPLSRVFGFHLRNGEKYLNTSLSTNAQSTDKSSLINSLSTRFKELSSGDRLFIIYNGHGLRDNLDLANSYLHLWNDTKLTVRELENIMTNIDPDVPVSFVMTQCFSGTFKRLIYKNAELDLGLSESMRCGFMAESEYDEAEGCSASVNTGDYRDYTTFFFSALSGYNRFNKAIRYDFDMDKDDSITLYDAHLYTLLNAHNSDIPRSTSETYLVAWEPWYLQWFSTLPADDNVYRTISEKLEDRIFPDTIDPDYIKHKNTLVDKLDTIENNKKNDLIEIEKLQNAIKNDLLAIWPEAKYAYTDSYNNFIKYHLNEAASFLKKHKRYNTLVDLQDKQLTDEQNILDIQRDITQIDKLIRLRKLARLLSVFNNHASIENKNAYNKLLQCEKQAL